MFYVTTKSRMRGDVQLTVHLLQCLHMRLTVVLMAKAMLSIHVHVAIMLGAIVVSHDVSEDHELCPSSFEGVREQRST
jgi:hypothetical protein